MPYHIEILSIGADLDSEISDAARILNAVQSDFEFALPPERLRSFGYTCVKEQYRTLEIWSLLEKYRAEAKGDRRHIIAVIDKKLRSERFANLFGSHQADRGFAAITIRDWHFYADSHRSFLCYYFIRYALSFVAPAIKSHPETRDCFFDFKGRKRDLELSLSSGRICDEHAEKLATKLNPEIKKSVEDMVEIMKAQHENSNTTLPAKSLKGSTQVGIIAVREDEFAAALEHFPTRRVAEGQNRFYEHARIRPRGQDEIGIAFTRMLEQGQNAAQAVATDMINDLAPQWILLVGIAGGIPDTECCLGDVILSSRVHDYAVSAAFEGGKVEHQQQGGPVHVEVEKMLANLVARKRDLTGWNAEATVGMARPIESVPDQPDDRYYGDEDWRQNVLKSMKTNFTAAAAARAPVFKVSPIIAGNTLMKDTHLAAQLAQSARHASAIEMEFGGVYTACRYAGSGNTRALAVRGLSDIIGYRRSPDWTAFACKTAASLTFALIAAGLFN